MNQALKLTFPEEYREMTDEERSIGGSEASGFRYHYTAQGIDMTGESCIGKKGSTFYYFQCYTRAALPENDAVWQQLLETAEWL